MYMFAMSVPAQHAEPRTSRSRRLELTKKQGKCVQTCADEISKPDRLSKANTWRVCPSADRRGICVADKTRPEPPYKRVLHGGKRVLATLWVLEEGQAIQPTSCILTGQQAGPLSLDQWGASGATSHTHTGKCSLIDFRQGSLDRLREREGEGNIHEPDQPKEVEAEVVTHGPEVGWAWGVRGILVWTTAPLTPPTMDTPQ